MLIVTTTYTRLSPLTPFYLDQAPVAALTFSDLMVTSEYAPMYDKIFSEDRLTCSTVATYINEEQLSNFLNELAAVLPTFFADRDAYGEANDITVTRTTQNA